MQQDIDPSKFLNLNLGLKRSEVYQHLGLPIPRHNWNNGLLGTVAKKLFGEEVDLDHGRGYSNFGGVRLFPRLNLRHYHGVELFFGSDYRLTAIWFEPPFATHVWGINLGDTADEVVEKRGEPLERTTHHNSNQPCFLYCPGEGTSIKILFRKNAVSEIAYGYPANV